ncbi:MAG: GNAT family N-acetyltransferase [Acidobacteria bacterium]|nr:GNAT family N-acetyltransferase [Acidobacteriota bacterium]
MSLVFTRVEFPSGRRVMEFLAAQQSVALQPVLSEYKAVRVGSQAVREWVATDSEDLVAYLQIVEHGPRSYAIEVVCEDDEYDVVPTLLSAATTDLDGPVQVWARTAQMMAAVENSGGVLERTLLDMQTKLPIPTSVLMPTGFSIRPFDTSRHSEALRRVNNRAFEGHREAGGLTAKALQKMFSLPWFREGDVIVAWMNEKLAGFCWTKCENAGVGEIYIVCVDPGFASRGLGRALVVSGFAHLHDTYGVSIGSLWTDAGNRAAVELYKSLGLVTSSENHAYGLELVAT